MHGPVVAWPTAGGAATIAVAEQALRFNHQLKFARLTAHGAELFAECRVHAELLAPDSLARAARATAAAIRHTRVALEILAGQQSVARWYGELFLPASRRTSHESSQNKSPQNRSAKK